jgi:hypothetical protein
MPEFIVELYRSRTDAATIAADAEGARRAAEELTREGTPVRLLRSIFVPDDETCLLLYEAASAAAVGAAAMRAGLRYERVAEAIEPGLPA